MAGFRRDGHIYVCIYGISYNMDKRDLPDYTPEPKGESTNQNCPCYN